jgi:RimJ/RimL family protein N-acetyltransferase
MQTARLELRLLTEDDLDALVELDGFQAVREVIDPFGEHIPKDAVARREYERRLLGRAGYLAAVERATGRLIGWFQFEADRDRSTEFELGFRFRPEVWGLGFATEGAEALLADGLSRPEVVRVYAHALLSNAGSIRVMQKIGMTYAGSWSYKGLEGAEYEALPGTGPHSAPAKRP